MSDNSDDRDPIEKLAESFVTRLRAGQRPNAAEYASRYPELAEKIQDLLPTLVQLEENAVAASAPPPTAPIPADPLPRRLGEYEIVREIGRGGMGIVYEAVQESLGRHVALKVLSAGGLLGSQLERFRREARAAAQLHHANIVPVFGVGELDGLHYYAMQYIRGPSLDQLIEESVRQRQGTAALPRSREGSSSQREHYRGVARLGRQVAEALSYAHGTGIIHRDIKPSNLLVDPRGTVWVTDFGLAKIEGTDGVTFAGDIVGTLRYMAPERFDGWCDPRSDVYSLGATLYELLALRPLHKHEVREKLIQQILHVPPLPLRRCDPRIPRDLETILNKSLAKEPGDRYASAQQMADDLGRFLADQPIVARRSTIVERLQRWCWRNPVIAGLEGLVLVLLIVVTVGSWIVSARLKDESDLARAAAQKADESERSRRQELVGSYLAQARAASTVEGQGQRLKGTQAIEDALVAVPWDAMTPERRRDLTNAAVRCLALYDLREIARRPAHSRFMTTGHRDIDVDGEFRLFARPVPNHEGTIVESLDAGPGVHQRYDGTTAEPTRHSIVRQFSPRGTWLLESWPTVLQTWQVRVWQLATRRLVLDFTREYGLNIPVFHPDERHLLFAASDDRLRLFDLETGQLVRESTPQFRTAHPAYSPDGTRLAIASWDQPARIVDSATWGVIASLPEIGPTATVAWNPDGQSLVFATADHRLYVCQTNRWTVGEWMESGHRNDVNLAYHPHGRLLASSGSDNSFKLWNPHDRHELITANGQVLRFSHDGGRLAVLDNDQLILYELIGSPCHRTIRCAAESASFSPDGRWLGVSGKSGVQLYRADDLTLAADLGLDHSGPVAFHPLGQSVTTYGIFSQAWTWPLDCDSGDCIGPPRPAIATPNPLYRFQVLAPQHLGRHAAWSADGQLLALADYRHDKVVVVPTNTGVAQEVAPFDWIAQVAISPDGAWVAGAAATSPAARVWSTTDRRVVLELPYQGGVAFSPDGQWFGSRSQDAVQLYRVPSWHCERRIDTPRMLYQHSMPLAFQPQGQILAITNADQSVELFDRTSGRPLVVLDDRASSHVSWLSFSPDGSRLAVTRSDQIAVWDLAALGAALADLGLRPEGLPQATVPTGPTDDKPTAQLVVDRGVMPAADKWYRMWLNLARHEASKRRWQDAASDISRALEQIGAGDSPVRAELLTLRGEYYYRSRNHHGARYDWESALRESPTLAQPGLWLARLLVLGPPEVRDPQRARTLANLFLAQGETDAAWTALRELARIRQGETDPPLALDQVPSDWRAWTAYVAALEYQRRNEPQRAHEALQLAIALHEEQANALADYQTDELDRLRSEAERATDASMPPEQR